MTRFDVPVIIGTGPSGIACAHSLIERGVWPVMIDGGVRPERGALALSRGLAADSIHSASGPLASGSKNNPAEKTWFGSSFATQQHPGSAIIYDPELIMRASHAVGGLSRIWGGTFAFFRGLPGWPQELRPIEADLDAVRALVPASLTDLSGADRPADGSIPGSAESARGMRAFAHAGRDAWDVEPSQIAIDSRPGSTRRCILAGTCLEGCPVDAIWYSGTQLQAWEAEGRVIHRSGLIVETVSEHADGVRLTLTDGVVREQVDAPRVYLAGGAVGTGALLVNSGLREQIVLRDTATAFAAAIQMRGIAAAPQTHHTLSQWWVRSRDARFLAQVYPPYAGNAQRLETRMPLLAKSPALITQLTRRLHPVIAYLGSDLSDRIRIGAEGQRVRVSARLSQETKTEFQKQMSAFGRVLTRSGYLMPVFATEFSQPGTGNHFGSSLPHGSETDALGRLDGLQRIHIVDSSVLPALEVGSITPTVMANAIRIGRESVKEFEIR